MANELLQLNGLLGGTPSCLGALVLGYPGIPFMSADVGVDDVIDSGDGTGPDIYERFIRRKRETERIRQLEDHDDMMAAMITLLS